MTADPAILHIDADLRARTLMTQAFLRSGMPGVLHSLSSASNALLYLNALGPFRGYPRPRLIILDLDLPRVEGADFLHTLRTNTRFKNIRTCVLMAALTEVNGARCRMLGIERFRAEPTTEGEADEVLAWVRTWWG